MTPDVCGAGSGITRHPDVTLIPELVDVEFMRTRPGFAVRRASKIACPPKKSVRELASGTFPAVVFIVETSVAGKLFLLSRDTDDIISSIFPMTAFVVLYDCPAAISRCCRV
jgi:hypothetical protein